VAGLTLEVVTPRGGFLREQGLTEVVVRRREARFDPGSEVAVLPGHGPMLVRLCHHRMRYRSDGRARYLEVRGGFAEVRDDVVTVLTPRAERVGPTPVG
jgi:F-type H+-transporting ATPase subunit epsilon